MLRKNKNEIILGILTLTIIFSALVLKVGTDDAWYARLTNTYLATGEFYDKVYGIYMPFANLFIFLNSLIFRVFGNNYLSGRIVNIFFSIGSLFVVKKIFSYLFQEDKTLILLATVLYIFFITASGVCINGRPEGFYIALFAFTMYFLFKFNECNRIYFLYLAVISASIAGSSHPNGIIAIAIIGIYFTIKAIKKEKIPFIHFPTLALLGGIILYIGLIWNKSLNEFLYAIKLMFTLPQHSDPFWKEILRYLEFLRDFPEVFPFLLLGIYGLLLFYVDYFKKKLSRTTENSFMTFMSIFIFVYLLLIRVKGHGYLIILSIFLATGIVYIFKKKNLQNFAYSAIIFLLVLSYTIIGKRAFVRGFEFKRVFHIPSQKINLINNVRSMVKGKNIIAPFELYFTFNDVVRRFEAIQNISGESFYRKIDLSQFDYAIIDFPYMKKIDLKNSEFVGSLQIAFHEYYGIFKLNVTKSTTE